MPQTVTGLIEAAAEGIHVAGETDELVVEAAGALGDILGAALQSKREAQDVAHEEDKADS